MNQAGACLFAEVGRSAKGGAAFRTREEAVVGCCVGAFECWYYEHFRGVVVWYLHVFEKNIHLYICSHRCASKPSKSSFLHFEKALGMHLLEKKHSTARSLLVAQTPLVGGGSWPRFKKLVSCWMVWPLRACIKYNFQHIGWPKKCCFWCNFSRSLKQIQANIGNHMLYLPFFCTKSLRILGSLQVRNLKVPRYKWRPGERNLQPQKTPKLPRSRSTVSWWWNEWNNEIAKRWVFWKVLSAGWEKNHTEKWSKKTG